jgi:hypothetical protein
LTVGKKEVGLTVGGNEALGAAVVGIEVGVREMVGETVAINGAVLQVTP